MKTRNFFIAGIAALLIVLFVNREAKANNSTQVKSHGRIVYQNNTPDDSKDDVIFDSGDMITLENRIKDLEVKVSKAEQSIQ